MEHEYSSLIKGEPKRIFLLLHGYLLDGEYLIKKLADSLPTDCLIISPNGPFLVPQKKGEEYFAKYSWYFFDPNKKSFYINYKPAAEFLKNLIQQINIDKLAISIIGYSQGGYLAPKVAELIPEVDSVLGLACIFRKKMFEPREDLVYHQIHGQNDLIVSIDESKEQWLEIHNKCPNSQYIELSGSGHRIDQEFLENIKNLSQNLTTV